MRKTIPRSPVKYAVGVTKGTGGTVVETKRKITRIVVPGTSREITEIHQQDSKVIRSKEPKETALQQTPEKEEPKVPFLGFRVIRRTDPEKKKPAPPMTHEQEQAAWDKVAPQFPGAVNQFG